jgi:ABC-type Fe3+-siderophore transport system permease subunit
MQRDWLDSIAWPQLGVGVLAGVILQIVVGLLLALLRQPSASGLGLVLANLCIGVAGFGIAWWLWPRRDEKSLWLNSALAGLVCAFISLIASALVSSGGTSLVGILLLFVGYVLFALLGSVLVHLLAPRCR